MKSRLMNATPTVEFLQSVVIYRTPTTSLRKVFEINKFISHQTWVEKWSCSLFWCSGDMPHGSSVALMLRFKSNFVRFQQGKGRKHKDS